MMPERRQRIGRCRDAVRKRNGPERRLARGGGVELHPEVPRQRTRVERRQLHEQVVRMLPVHERLPTECLAGLQKQRVALSANRPRLRAQHGAERKLAAGGWLAITQLALTSWRSPRTVPCTS